jgi:hypothetical protein
MELVFGDQTWIDIPAWATRGEEIDDQDLNKPAREFARRF